MMSRNIRCDGLPRLHVAEGKEVHLREAEDSLHRTPSVMIPAWRLLLCSKEDSHRTHPYAGLRRIRLIRCRRSFFGAFGGDIVSAVAVSRRGLVPGARLQLICLLHGSFGRRYTVSQGCDARDQAFR